MEQGYQRTPSPPVAPNEGAIFLPLFYEVVIHLVSICVIGYHQISSFLVDRMKDAESCPRTHTASD